MEEKTFGIFIKSLNKGKQKNSYGLMRIVLSVRLKTDREVEMSMCSFKGDMWKPALLKCGGCASTKSIKIL